MRKSVATSTFSASLPVASGNIVMYMGKCKFVLLRQGNITRSPIRRLDASLLPLLPVHVFPGTRVSINGVMAVLTPTYDYRNCGIERGREHVGYLPRLTILKVVAP